MTSFSQASTNEGSCSKEQQGATSAVMVGRKAWAGQAEDYEEWEENFVDNQELSTQITVSTPRQGDTSSEMAVAIVEQVSIQSPRVQIKTNLSPSAAAFVPTGQQQSISDKTGLEGVTLAIQSIKGKEKIGQQHALTTAGSSSIHNFDATGTSSSMASKYNLTPTNILHALVSHDLDKLKAFNNLRNDQGALVTGYNHIDNFGMHMGQEFFEEGEEDELLDATFNIIAREGDLSPRHVRSGSNKIKKKAPDRQHSWDGKVTQEVVIRKPPMRSAKQKAVVPTASTRSNRSKTK